MFKNINIWLVSVLVFAGALLFCVFQTDTEIIQAGLLQCGFLAKTAEVFDIIEYIIAIGVYAASMRMFFAFWHACEFEKRGVKEIVFTPAQIKIEKMSLLASVRYRIQAELLDASFPCALADGLASVVDEALANALKHRRWGGRVSVVYYLGEGEFIARIRNRGFIDLNKIAYLSSQGQLHSSRSDGRGIELITRVAKKIGAWTELRSAFGFVSFDVWYSPKDSSVPYKVKNDPTEYMLDCNKIK